MKNQTLIPVLVPAENASGALVSLSYDKTMLSTVVGYYPQHISLCSTLPIKEGDWIIDYFADGTYKPYKIRNSEEAKIANEYKPNSKPRIEFTTDPKLIADGVPKIDGNTKALIKCYYCKGKFHEQCSECYGTGKNEAYFLKEFCKRYKQNDNHKVENLAAEYYGYNYEDDRSLTDKKREAYVECYNQAIQSNNNPLTELISELKETLKKCSPEFKDGIQHSILRASSYLEKQSKGDIVIECEMENAPIIMVHDYRIKLKDGQPILIFK